MWLQLILDFYTYLLCHVYLMAFLIFSTIFQTPKNYLNLLPIVINRSISIPKEVETI